MNSSSLELVKRIRKLNRFRDSLPLCFMLEYSKWQKIESDLNIVPLNEWRELIETLNWLGDYFLIANCFNILGFRVNRLGDSKEDERARVLDGLFIHHQRP